MYDELVKRLRVCGDSNDSCGNCPDRENDGSCPYGEWEFAAEKYMLQAADAIEELSKQFDDMNEANIALYGALPKWTSVEEKLPEAGQRVLCYCRANIYEVMKMRTDRDWVQDINHVYMSGFVTHWMPLPEPPEEEA
jgi:hypothetical protein